MDVDISATIVNRLTMVQLIALSLSTVKRFLFVLGGGGGEKALLRQPGGHLRGNEKFQSKLGKNKKLYCSVNK